MSHGFAPISTDQDHGHRVDLPVMDTPQPILKHSDLTEKIIGIFYDVYNELGHGFLESTYAEALVVALGESGLSAAREVPVPVWFRGRTEVGVGLLLNFGMRPQFRRLLFDNERKKIRENPRESVAKVSA